jgi:hypothetical protein
MQSARLLMPFYLLLKSARSKWAQIDQHTKALRLSHRAELFIFAPYFFALSCSRICTLACPDILVAIDWIYFLSSRLDSFFGPIGKLLLVHFINWPKI